MTRYEKKNFEDQHVVLDEGVFIGSIFKNRSLEYPAVIQDGRGQHCPLVWRDAAQRTVALLQGFGLLAQSAVTMLETPGKRLVQDPAAKVWSAKAHNPQGA